jgi:hypothetical protein
MFLFCCSLQGVMLLVLVTYNKEKSCNFPYRLGAKLKIVSKIFETENPFQDKKKHRGMYAKWANSPMSC